MIFRKLFLYTFPRDTKGQFILEQQIYAVLKFPKMQQNIARISALAFKMSQIKAHYHHN